MRSPYCGRVDPHPPHEWRGHDRWPFSAPRECPGAPVIEGGHGPISVRVSEAL